MEYEWYDDGGIISKYKYEPIMFYILFKSINLATGIGLSNLKDKIVKETQANFFQNEKVLLGDMSSNYTIIIGE